MSATVINIPAWLEGAVQFLMDATNHIPSPRLSHGVVGRNPDGSMLTAHTISPNEALLLLQERQMDCWKNVVDEMNPIRAGRKRTHWIWWVMPTTFQGGQEARNAAFYGVRDPRMERHATYVTEITAAALMTQDSNNPTSPFGQGPMQMMLTAVCDCLYSTMRDNGCSSRVAMEKMRLNDADIGRMKCFATLWNDLIHRWKGENGEMTRGGAHPVHRPCPICDLRVSRRDLAGGICTCECSGCASCGGRKGGASSRSFIKF